MKIKILYLTLIKQWFDKIASGEKKEEYREVKKYWVKRLVSHIQKYNSATCFMGLGYETIFKEFDIIRFRNGYAKNAPEMDVCFEGIELKKGKPEWGAKKGVEYLTIKLGNILIIRNYHYSG